MGNEIEKLQLLLQEDPSNFQTRRELSIILANEGFNEEALSNLLYLLKYFPEDAELNYNIGILYEKLKDFKKAKSAYERAIELSPQEDFYYNLGEVLVTLGEWDEAITAFKTVLKTDSQDGNCYFNLGLCYYHKDDLNLAIDHFQKAKDLNPKDIFAYFYLGNIYQGNGLTNFAQKNYEKVLELSPDYSWAYFNLASIAFQNDNIGEAKEYLIKTIECNKQDIEAYKLLTKICLKESESEEIITILETRLESEENGDLFYVLSQVYKQIGSKEDYIANLKKAIKNNLTLTYPYNIVKAELERIQPQDELEVEEVEEYNSGNEFDDEFDEEFEDDSEKESEYDDSDYDEDNEEDSYHESDEYEEENSDYSEIEDKEIE